MKSTRQKDAPERPQRRNRSGGRHAVRREDAFRNRFKKKARRRTGAPDVLLQA
jgi:hypothetical protein